MSNLTPDPKRDDNPVPVPSGAIERGLELSDLWVPGEVLQHRELFVEYIRSCRTGFSGPNRLIDIPSRMSFEDLNCFAHLEERIRGNIHKTVLAHVARRDGDIEERVDVQVRILHQVVAVSKVQREQHLFVDVLGSNLSSIMAWRGCMEQFVTGPVALHLYTSDYYQSGQIIARPIMSQPAFKEAVANLSRLADGQIQATSDSSRGSESSWGMKWIISAVNSHHPVLLDGVQEGRIKASDLCNFRHVQRESSTKELFCFEIGSVEYQAELTLNEEHKRPDVYLYARLT